MRLLFQMSGIILGTFVYAWWKWPDRSEVNFALGVLIGVSMTLVNVWCDRRRQS